MDASDFAKLIPALKAQITAAIHQTIIHAADLIADEAKNNIIGHGLPDWPAFAESTESDPRRQGPLLREGELRDSITTRVTLNTASVGSDSPVAVIQEHGDSHVPPRSFLGAAAIAKAPEIVKELEVRLQAAFKPK